MSGEAAALIRSWPVGPWTVTLTAPTPRAGSLNSIAMEWNPGLPDRPLSADELQQYRDGRNAAIRELGLTALVIDL